VVQGYSPDLNWRLLAEGAVAIRSGALWVATNLDVTVPSPRGPLPGNGAMVGALRLATRVEPVATGKPDPTMHRETLLRTQAEHPLVVGDRLDTDIEGANAVGCPSLLVFSGVATVPDLLDAPPDQRPTYLGADLSAILDEHPAPQESGATMRCGRWAAARDGDALRLSLADADADGPGSARPDAADGGFDDDTLDAVRALCAARWSYWDAPADPTSDARADRDAGDRDAIAVTHGDGTAKSLLEKLGLASR
jgi:glycerol 3-phosphatase-2